MLRDNLVGLIEPMLSSAGVDPLALCMRGKSHRTIDPHALKIPPPKDGGVYALDGERRFSISR